MRSLRDSRIWVASGRVATGNNHSDKVSRRNALCSEKTTVHGEHSARDERGPIRQQPFRGGRKRIH
jgi:hypothetical protein